MKIRIVGAELFHADGRTDIRDDANSSFSQFLRTRPKRVSLSRGHVLLQRNRFVNFPQLSLWIPVTAGYHYMPNSGLMILKL